MGKSLIPLFALLCVTSAQFYPGAGYAGPWVLQSWGEVWPKPISIEQRNDEVAQISSGSFSFDVDSAASSCATLMDSLDRFYDRMFPETLTRHAVSPQEQDGRASITTLSVQLLGECEDWPSHDMIETYSLNVDATGSSASVLSSDTVWGLLRGLETFTHLVYLDNNNEFSLNTTIIDDGPRFPFRGYMIDTSRHFLPKSIILDSLDLMEMSKMNVLHWHMTDDPSFPYQSTSFPELADEGSFDSVTHVYTPSDVAEILDAARLRGIRVIPEFDTPGHTQSWGEGIPDLLTVCYENGSPADYTGPMDPTKEYVYSVLNTLFAELADVFPDEYVHLGGDEVDTSCWASNPDINAIMEIWGIEGQYSELQSIFIARVLEIVGNLPKKSIVWEEVWENGDPLASDTIVDVWKDWEDWSAQLAECVSQQQPAILSAPWYLNYINYGVDWINYYNVDPLGFDTGNDDDKLLMYGGEACMWAEYVDSANIIPRTWPRASAVAERLWSPETVNDQDEAAPRMQEHQCRMLARGYQVQPPNGPSFCQVEWGDIAP